MSKFRFNNEPTLAYLIIISIYLCYANIIFIMITVFDEATNFDDE